MTTPLFSWRCRGQPQQYGDRLPAPTEPVIELILTRDSKRMKAEGHPQHLAHPAHESAMRGPLPATLRILRIDGCRIRTWPALPLSIHEFYASGCDFFTFPDLSAYGELIVIEMPDNRIEELVNPLPPTLARLNLSSNAIQKVMCVPPTTLQNAQFGNNPGLEKVAADEESKYRAAVRAAAAAQPPMPPPVRPSSSIPAWVAATAVVVHLANRMRPRDRHLEPAREVNPYKNDQNVHDTGIQDSTKENLTYLANYRPDVPPFKDIAAIIVRELSKEERKTRTWLSCLWDSVLGISYPSRVAQEVRLRCSQPYVMHGVMPAEIVDRLWLRIMDFEGETRDEVMKRFCDEVIDAAPHCTNGFMVRMANVLIGYDENCVMRMRPTQILQARVPATMARLRKKLGLAEGATEPWTFWRDCVVQTWEDMEEVDMDYRERSSWLTDLIAPLLPELCKGIFKEMRGEPPPLNEADSDMVAYKLRTAIEDAKLNKPAKDAKELSLTVFVREDAMRYLQEVWR